VSIAYTVFGEGRLDLAFVGGFVSHLEIGWKALSIRRFSERSSSFCRVIAWDKREQVLSDRVGQPPTLEQGMDGRSADSALCAEWSLYALTSQA
jgi:hypothetical protein